VNIIFKGRRTDVQERFRRHASAKLTKIERLDRRAIRIDVEISTERNPRQSDRRERVELTIRSRGPVIRAEAAADDRYVALDRALSKLEARLRRSRDRRKSRHAVPAAERGTAPRPVPAGASRPLTAEPGSAAGNERAGDSGPGPALEESPEPQPAALTGADEFIPIQMEGDGPVVVREKFHAATPMSIDQALLEMELVGHDFYLFRDDAVRPSERRLPPSRVSVRAYPPDRDGERRRRHGSTAGGRETGPPPRTDRPGDEQA
jgi:ribosomal subunit interface protein